MNEELSRLLAGELDAASEAALLARIASDPSLAAAWERMAALPDLLAALPMEAPPPALLAKLHAMTPDVATLAEAMLAEDALDAAFAELAARPASAAALSFDPAPFAPDPREDTIDPEPPRPGKPVRLSAVRADARAPVSRSRAERAHAAAPSRRAWLAAGVAAAALALGVGVGLTAGGEAATANLTLAAGESVVEGDVHVRAGDLDLRVDGRARISVTPLDGAALADASGAELVVVSPEASAGAAPRARAEGASDAGLVVIPGRSAASERRASADAAPRSYAVASTPGRAAAPVGSIVTVEVERGAAVVSASGRDVRVAAGQTRSFDPAGAPAIVSAPQGPEVGSVEGARPESPGVRVDPSVAHRDLPAGGLSALPRVLAALETTPAEWPTDLDESWLPEGVEARMLDVEALVADAELADLDCDEYPCVAVYVSTGADPAWIVDVRATLRDHFPARAAFLDVVEGLDGRTLAVAVGPIDAPAARIRLDRRLDDAVRDVRREPSHP